MSMNKLMYDAIAALAVATDNHRAASERTSLARREETDALNKVNEAQAAIDKLVADVKKSAPRDSNWKRSPSQGVPA